MSKAFTDVIRRIGYEGEDPLTIAPDVPVLSVRVFADGGTAQDYWGRLDFSLPVALARELAKALMATADELDAL